MENVNAVGRGEARTGTFDSADVLAPCNRIDEKYRTECYGQHADYILKSLSGSLLSATQACERAGKKSWMSSCIRHLGQNMTTYDYQTKYLGNFDLSTAAMGALTLCARFPALRQADCRTGAAHNFMLYDHPKEAVTFCNLSGDPECSRVVIPYLKRPLYSPQDRERICAYFTDPVVRKTCLHPVLFPFKRELTGTVIISFGLCGILVLLMRSRVRPKVSR